MSPRTKNLKTKEIKKINESYWLFKDLCYSSKHTEYTEQQKSAFVEFIIPR